MPIGAEMSLNRISYLCY